jgi:hypothetical protein
MSTASPTICHYSTPVMCVEFFFIVNMDIMMTTYTYTVALSFKATPSAMKKWPYKREGLYWEGLFIRILLSQCIWNDGLRWHGLYKRGTLSDCNEDKVWGRKKCWYIIWCRLKLIWPNTSVWCLSIIYRYLLNLHKIAGSFGFNFFGNYL